MPGMHSNSFQLFTETYRFEIQFIIIVLKSVYGIEQLINELSYASDVLGILLNVNRWVKTNEILRCGVKPE
jgi:hypothetical protein